MKSRVIAVAVFLAATRIAAQVPPPNAADSLLQQGLIGQAETMYYAAVRAAPRSPDARLRLGRYLIARGATRVGAVLVEEAVQFGLDPRTGARVLAPAYEYLADFQSLAKLPASVVGATAIERARWLVDHPMRVASPDSVTSVDFRERLAGDTIGTVGVRINGRSFTALISARARGVSLDPSTASAVRARRFPASADSDGAALGVVDSIELGRLVVKNSPVRLELSGAARGVTIGLDALMRFSPTFDGPSGKLLLRASGSLGDAPAPTALATMLTNGQMLVLLRDDWASVAVPNVARALQGKRWTIDAKRGQIIVER